MNKTSILLVVEDPRVASMLSQQLRNVKVVPFMSATYGAHYDAVVVLDPLSTSAQQAWANESLRTRVGPSGHYIAIEGGGAGLSSIMPVTASNKPPMRQHDELVEDDFAPPVSFEVGAAPPEPECDPPPVDEVIDVEST